MVARNRLVIPKEEAKEASLPASYSVEATGGLPGQSDVPSLSSNSSPSRSANGTSISSAASVEHEIGRNHTFYFTDDHYTFKVSICPRYFERLIGKPARSTINYFDSRVTCLSKGPRKRERYFFAKEVMV
jgi:hypothetical protein